MMGRTLHHTPKVSVLRPNLMQQVLVLRPNLMQQVLAAVAAPRTGIHNLPAQRVSAYLQSIRLPDLPEHLEPDFLTAVVAHLSSDALQRLAVPVPALLDIWDPALLTPAGYEHYGHQSFADVYPYVFVALPDIRG